MAPPLGGEALSVCLLPLTHPQKLFEEQLKKYDQLRVYLEQNLAAQDNVLRALTEANVQYAAVRRVLSDLDQKSVPGPVLLPSVPPEPGHGAHILSALLPARWNSTLQTLVASFEAYEDLMKKSQEGKDFYADLESKVAALLARAQATCQAREAARQQLLDRWVWRPGLCVAVVQPRAGLMGVWLPFPYLVPQRAKEEAATTAHSPQATAAPQGGGGGSGGRPARGAAEPAPRRRPGSSRCTPLSCWPFLHLHRPRTPLPLRPLTPWYLLRPHSDGAAQGPTGPRAPCNGHGARTRCLPAPCLRTGAGPCVPIFPTAWRGEQSLWGGRATPTHCRFAVGPTSPVLEPRVGFGGPASHHHRR